MRARARARVHVFKIVLKLFCSAKLINLYKNHLYKKNCMSYVYLFSAFSVYNSYVSFANVKIITYLSCIVDEMMYKHARIKELRPGAI